MPRFLSLLLTLHSPAATKFTSNSLPPSLMDHVWFLPYLTFLRSVSLPANFLFSLSVGFSWLPSFLASPQPLSVELLKSLSSALFSSPSAISRILSINMTSSSQESWICTSSMARPDVFYPTIRSHLSHLPPCLLIANNDSSSVISN